MTDIATEIRALDDVEIDSVNGGLGLAVVAVVVIFVVVCIYIGHSGEHNRDSEKKPEAKPET